MIYDKLTNLKKYAPMIPALGMIADYLGKNDLKETENGSYPLTDGVILNVSEYEPFPKADKWEAHRQYIDLQIVITGNEKLDSAPIENVTGGEGFHEDDDYELYTGCSGTYATIFADESVFAVFEPCDAHRPGILLDTKSVKKAVFKIPV